MAYRLRPGLLLALATWERGLIHLPNQARPGPFRTCPHVDRWPANAKGRWLLDRSDRGARGSRRLPSLWRSSGLVRPCVAHGSSWAPASRARHRGARLIGSA